MGHALRAVQGVPANAPSPDLSRGEGHGAHMVNAKASAPFHTPVEKLPAPTNRPSSERTKAALLGQDGAASTLGGSPQGEIAQRLRALSTQQLGSKGDGDTPRPRSPQNPAQAGGWGNS